MRTSVIPPSSGQYQIATRTNNIAAGMSGNGTLFAARWTSTTKIAVVTYVGIPGMRASTAFAAGVIDVILSIGRSWTVAPTGGNALDLTGNNNKMRTSMASSAFAANDVRIADTGALTNGTVTIDAQAVGTVVTSSSGGFAAATPIIGSQYVPDLVLFDADISRGDYPIVLAANEGLLVRGTVPATGVWNLGIEMHWFECAPSGDF